MASLRRIKLIMFLLTFSTFYYAIARLQLHSTPIFGTKRDKSVVDETKNLSSLQSNAVEPCETLPISLPPPFFHPARQTETHLLQIPTQKTPVCHPRTPLFIAFGTNSCMLEQTILSFIAAGWPPSQIVVVDNTGTSRANVGEFSDSSQHTYLNYSHILDYFGANIYQSPTRQTFSQLQNLLLELAHVARWDNFYFSHQDIIVRNPLQGDRSFYENVLDEYDDVRERYREDQAQWAFSFFHYDWLTHVNVLAADRIGSWDVLIPWYMSDCDYYGRVRLAGLDITDYYAGEIYDLDRCIQDPEQLLLTLTHPREYHVIENALRQLGLLKRERGRNSWRGQPNLGISDDFGPRFWELVEAGRRNFYAKWKTTQCDITRPRKISILRWLSKISGLIRMITA